MAYSSLPIIFLVALVSSFAFARETGKRGYDPRKPSRFPIFLGFGVMAFNFLVIQLCAVVVGSMGGKKELADLLGLLTDIFCTALFIAGIAKNWRLIKKLPDRRQPAAAESATN